MSDRISVAGLSDSEASARLRADGYNELPSGGRRSILRIVGDVAREPMFVLLLSAGAIYLVLGEAADAAILILFATMSISITIIQETRSERVLEALRDLTSPRALVLRSGQSRRIPGREVVRGDLIVLAEGDRVPADGLLADSDDLEADESLLTGESIPVRKRPGTASDAGGGARPGGDNLPFVFSGTLVVRGRGKAVVTATGLRSEIGRIGKSLTTIQAEPPRLQAETRRMVRVFGLLGFAMSTAAVLVYGLANGRWLEALLGGIALGMSMLPEEFPLVLSVFMVMGAWRISKARVLTRRAAAIETLGSATVLCTDKTGTLTENRMSVVFLGAGEVSWEQGGQDSRLPEEIGRVLHLAALASDPESGDPMDRAIHALAADRRRDAAPVEIGGVVRRYGLRPGLAAVAHVWRGPGSLLVAAKGAPETIATFCRLDGEQREAVHRAVAERAALGIRVLAVAYAFPPGGPLPESQDGFAYTFAGLVGFADPLRRTVPRAVEDCRSAGIRVLMITGDHPATAAAIAEKAGLQAGEVLTGAALAELSEGELVRRLRNTTVFARILPEQKLRIVEALKRSGEVVAMTGDGVNDAPALKAAHIGIAMGGRGTDVAREAASMVLLDDDFGSIVRAVRLGRRIYDNLRKAMTYVVAVHIPIAGLALLPPAFGLPLLLTPMLIAFLEMVIDPACSIVFEAEAEEEDVMDRPPRDPQSPLITRSLLLWSFAQGALALVAVTAVTTLAVARDLSVDEIRGVAFAALVATNIALIFGNRSRRGPARAAGTPANRALWVGLAIVGSLLSVSLFWEPARLLFRFGNPPLTDLAVAGGAGLLLLALISTARRWVVRDGGAA